MISLALALALLQAKPPPLPKDPSTLVRIVDQARLPHLAMDADGGVYIAFVLKGNIALAVSTDGGATFAPPVIALDARGRDPAVPNRAPRVVVDRQKRVYVSAPLCLAAPNAPVINDLYFAVSTDRGKTFGRAYMINDTAGSAADSVHWTAAGGAELHVAWLDLKGKGYSLSYAKFSDQGKRVSKTSTVAPFCCEHCPPALAVDGKGQPWVAWREAPRDPAAKTNRQVFVTTSTDGGKSFGAVTQLNTVDSGLEACPQEPPVIAVTADGKTIAAAWMDRRDLERDANVYWTFGPPGKLSRDTDVHDDRRFLQRRPSIAYEADGTLWCAWEDGRLSTQRVFYTNTKDVANIPLGDAKEGGGASPSLAAAGGKVAIAYECGEGIGFRVLAGK
jgi:hypothetical protein